MTTVYNLPDAARYPRAAFAHQARGSEEPVPDLRPRSHDVIIVPVNMTTPLSISLGHVSVAISNGPMPPSPEALARLLDFAEWTADRLQGLGDQLSNLPFRSRAASS